MTDSPSDYETVAFGIRGSAIFDRLFTEGAAYSHLLPTRRWGEAVYAMFSCPALILPDVDEPPGPPDRWAAFETRRGSLRCFSFTDITSFADEPVKATQPRPAPSGQRQSIEEAETNLAEIDRLLALLAPAFLSGTEHSGTEADKTALLTELETWSYGDMLGWERALAPDFFRWLQGEPT